MMKSSRLFNFAKIAFVAIAVAGCTALPGQGPSTSAFTQSSAAQSGFELVDVDADVLAVLGSTDMPTLSFGGRGTAQAPAISVGDRVAVSVFEAGSGGLFIGAGDPESAGTGPNTGAIPQQVVGSDGSITVPYVGRVRVAGLTQGQAEQRIRTALEGQAIQPQVLISVVQQTGSSVTVIGAVGGGGRVPLSQAGDRVLDVLAAAGGVSIPVQDAMINVSRGGHTASVPMRDIVANPSENIYVRSGDTITVTAEPLVFFSAGATGRNAEVPFGGESITVQQAVSRAGGLLDNRANPSGVFLLRLENPQVVSQLIPSSPLLSTGGLVPVAYRFDFRDPYALFLAQAMEMRHHDTLFVTNAALSDFSKLTQLFNAAAAPVATTAGLVN